MSEDDHPQVLVRGCEGVGVQIAVRCAVAGYLVTVMADDAFDLERTEHAVQMSLRAADAAPTLISMRLEAQSVPDCDFAFAPPDLMPRNARFLLCLCEPEQLEGGEVAVHVHRRIAELSLGHTSRADADAIRFLFADLGLPVVVAPEGARRFVGAALQEAFAALADQVLLLGAVPWDVDEALEAIGFDEGVFAGQDARGLGPTHADAPLLIRDRMVHEGRLGRMVGVGWYRYPGGGGAVIDPLMEDMITEEARFAGIARTAQAPRDIQDRLMLGLACIGARLIAARKIRDMATFQMLVDRILGAPDILAYLDRFPRKALAAKVAGYAEEGDDLWDFADLTAMIANARS